MKILFVLPLINSPLSWHQGVASLATYVRRGGHDVRLFELSDTDFTEINSVIDRYKPDVVAATSNTHQLGYVHMLAEQVKRRYPHIFFVVGGVAISIDETEIQKSEFADAYCRGEGEEPLVQLLSRLESQQDISSVPNIINPYNTETFDKKCEYYVEDLDTLPIADRALFSFYRNAEKDEVLPFRVSFLFCRGCPFDCTYCCNSALKGIFPDARKYVRWPSASRAIEEIVRVSDQYQFHRFVIDDDIFTLDKAWTNEFIRLYPSSLKNKTFEVNVRIGTVNRDIVKGLKDCGCKLIKIGLESGDGALRSSVLNRKMSNEMIKDTILMIKNENMPVHTFNMVGIPGEGHRSIWKTIKMNQWIKPERLQVTVYYPYPHTQLGEKCLGENRVSGRADSYLKVSVIEHDKLPKIIIQLYAVLLPIFVYMMYSPRKVVRELRNIASFLLRLIPGMDTCITVLKKYIVRFKKSG